MKIDGSEFRFQFFSDKEIVDELLKCIELNRGIMKKVVIELPKKMKIVVKDLHPLAYDILDLSNQAATFHRGIKIPRAGFNYDSIWIFPKRLQLVRTVSKDTNEFQLRMLSIFLHELAHYLASDEEATNEIVEKWLGKKPLF